MKQNNRKSKFRRTSKKNGTNSNRNADFERDSQSYNNTGASNDPQWYNVHPDLVRDAGSIYFNKILGSKFNKWDQEWHPVDTTISSISSTTTDKYVADALPGFAVLSYIAGPGISSDPNSAINKAATDMYSRIRYENSGSRTYSKTDLIKFLLIMDEIYQWWGSLQRVYGLCMSFSPVNNYTPEYMVKALGFDFDDLMSNLTQFRAHINTLARKIARRYVPGNLNIYRRHIWMTQNMYLDSMNDVAQRYLFRPAGYRTWDDTTGVLTFHGLALSPALTLSGIEAITDSLIEPVLASEDFGIISGDILKVYGDSGVMQVGVMPEDYAAPIVYDESVLSMIENAVICNGGGWNITSSVGTPNTDEYIIYEPYLTIKQNAVWLAALDKVMNFHHSDPQPLEIMYSSRFMNSFDKADLSTVANVDATKQFPLTSCGAEVLIAYRMYTFHWKEDGSVVAVGLNLNSYMQQGLTQGSADFMRSVLGNINYSAFNYAPRILMGGYADSDNTQYQLMFDSCKYDVATKLSDANVKALNDVAMLSLWDFPFKAVGPKH